MSKNFRDQMSLEKEMEFDPEAPPPKKQKIGQNSPFSSSTPPKLSIIESFTKKAVDTVKMMVGGSTPSTPPSAPPSAPPSSVSSIPTAETAQPSGDLAPIPPTPIPPEPTPIAPKPTPIAPKPTAIPLQNSSTPTTETPSRPSGDPTLAPPQNLVELKDELLKSTLLKRAEDQTFTIPNFRAVYKSIGTLMQKKVGPLQMNMINKTKASEFLRSGIENNHFDNSLIEEILKILGPYQEPIKRGRVSSQSQTKKNQNEKGSMDKKQFVEGLVEETVKEFTPKFMVGKRGEFEKELEEFKKLSDPNSMAKEIAKNDVLGVYYQLGEDERNQKAVDAILEKNIAFKISNFCKKLLCQGNFPSNYDCWGHEDYVKFGEIKGEIKRTLREKLESY